MGHAPLRNGELLKCYVEELSKREVVEQLLAAYGGVKLPPHGDDLRDFR